MSDVPAEYPTSNTTGARLDPVDNMPLFGEVDGVWMSRERYLDATREGRRQSALDELHQLATEGSTEPEAAEDADA